MADLREVVGYICEHYPRKKDLSKARLTKMVYLADWKSAIERKVQLTTIEWVFNHYGPYVEDVYRVAKDDSAFEVQSTENYYGDPKDLIKLKESLDYLSLSDEDKEVLDFVISTSKTKTWERFIQLIYSTYPVVTEDRYSNLNLVELAQDYELDQILLDT